MNIDGIEKILSEFFLNFLLIHFIFNSLCQLLSIPIFSIILKHFFGNALYFTNSSIPNELKKLDNEKI